MANNPHLPHGLDPAKHARIIGAPGSGKTALLLEVAHSLLADYGWAADELLLLTRSRSAHTLLRQRFEAGLRIALGAIPVRTSTSYAFSVLRVDAASRGDATPRLLTGSVQDELLREILREASERGESQFAPEVLQSQSFRNELRELARIIDDFGVAEDNFQKLIAGATKALQSVGDGGGTSSAQRQGETWIFALQQVSRLREAIARRFVAGFTASGMLRRAAEIIASRGAFPGAGVPGRELTVPRLVLVDDAQELDEGTLAVLAALAQVGSSVWVFGDADVATGTFRGSAPPVLVDLTSQLLRRGATVTQTQEQLVVLDRVFRHGPKIRQHVREITEHIGTRGVFAHRAATAAALDRHEAEGEVLYALANSHHEQLGMVANRLRATALGIVGNTPQPYSNMAVICRTRSEAVSVASQLAWLHIPTRLASGGIVLSERKLVRDLLTVLRVAFGGLELDAALIKDLLCGPVCGLDNVTFRRLRNFLVLWEHRQARKEEREIRGFATVLVEVFTSPDPISYCGGDTEITGSGLHELAKLAKLVRDAQLEASSGDVQQVLWQLWNSTKLAQTLQHRALQETGSAGEAAHNDLDAVLALFYALARYIEQGSSQPLPDFLRLLASGALPEDTLALRSERDAVTVTTPHGTVGAEYDTVVICGPQDGSWPNLRVRGTILGSATLERFLQVQQASAPTRAETLHDELGLFAQACSRAKNSLLVVAVQQEDETPSRFFGQRSNIPLTNLPSSRVTLRGAVAELRRRVTVEPTDQAAVEALAHLALSGVPGAHPDEWYGARGRSSETGITEALQNSEGRIQLSPSTLQQLQDCPLNWLLGRLGADTTSFSQAFGTLLHLAFETAGEIKVTPETTIADIRAAAEEVIRERWGVLEFSAGWEEQQQLNAAAQISEAIAQFLFTRSKNGYGHLGSELRFSAPLGDNIQLSGIADRIEYKHGLQGKDEALVIDLKTGGTTPTKQEITNNLQLMAYQYAISKDGFEIPAEHNRPLTPGGAGLLFVSPKAVGKKGGYKFMPQAELTTEHMQSFLERIEQISADIGDFATVAKTSTHCLDKYKSGRCSLHTVFPVSYYINDTGNTENAEPEWETDKNNGLFNDLGTEG